jgi:signal peptidase I
MLRTLQVDDMFLVNRWAYALHLPRRGDIVVFTLPPAAHAAAGQQHVKRIVAIAGDTVEVRKDRTILNGTPVDEPYAYIAHSEFESPLQNAAPVTVPPDCVYVLGDNRENSDDSRSWQFLPISNITGRAYAICLPFARLGFLH